MCVEAIVGRADQLPVELAPAVLRCGDQHDRLSLRIEGISDAPLDFVDGWPKLLHVRVLRSFQRVGPGATELRAVLLQQLRVGCNLPANRCVEGPKLSPELLVEEDRPHPWK